jgi:hypothetical protein
MGGEPPRPLASTVSLYDAIADPDDHYSRARAAGAKIVRELVDQSPTDRVNTVRVTWRATCGRLEPMTPTRTLSEALSLVRPPLR